MLAPRGDQYVIENLFQGYVEKDVLDQALFDLISVDVRGNSSDADLSLDRVELTESGGSIEYFTVTNKGNKEVNLKGFSLRAVDPRSGEVNDRSAGVQITRISRWPPERSYRLGERRISWMLMGTRSPAPSLGVGR
jgi:hypothetical protein